MILQADNISYSYKSKRNVNVLSGLSMEFERGKMYAILGESGSGKTTLLSLLAGLDVPTDGCIRYMGKPVLKKSLNQYRRENMSLVFQSYNLIDYLSPIENVTLGGKGNPAELLRSVNIDEADFRRNVLQLSGGQQQRVAIARALSSSSQILLADEPTGNLDATTAQGIIELLKRSAHEQGKCVIVVTHSEELARQSDVVFRI